MADTLTFLRDVRLRTRIPEAQLNYSDADTLSVATQELWGDVAPLIMSEQQEHFVTRSDVQLVDGQSAYRIPARAMGAKLRDAVLVRQSTGETRNLVRWEPEEVVGWEANRGVPTGFVVEGISLRLYPTPSGMADHSLRMTFYGRPGELVLPVGACKVLGTDVSNGIIYLSDLTTNAEGQVTAGDPGTVFVPGLLRVDLVRGTAHYDTIWSESLVSLNTAVSPAEMTVQDGTSIADLNPGDWVCVPGTAPVVQLPPEFHPLLTLKTAAVQLSATGDAQGAAEAQGLAALKEKRAGALVLPRVDGQPLKQRNGMDRWRTGWGLGGWYRW